jgi:PAS domain S-box-containing protein
VITDRILSCLIVLAILIAGPAARAETPAQPKSVLVLFSGAPGTPAYEILFERLETALREDVSEPLNLYVEYLEASRFPGDTFLVPQFQLINRKYADIKMDLLVLVGPGIIPLISRYAVNLAEIPNICIEFETYTRDVPASFRSAGIARIDLHFDFRKSIETALSLHPRASALYVISGSSPSDRNVEKMARDAGPEFERRIKITYLSDLSMQELLEQVQKIPAGSVILYLAFSRDRTGIRYYPREVLREISERSRVPIYGIYDSYIGHGTVGGYVLSAERIGDKAGDLGRRLLRGERPDSLPVIREGINLHMFYGPELKRWRIEEASLPPDSIVKNRQYSAWELYRWYIIGGILFILFQTVIVGFLVVLVGRQKRAEASLREAEERYRSLYEDAPVAYLSARAEDGAILECNETAAHLLGYGREAILKMNVFDIYYDQEPGKKEDRNLFGRVRQGEALQDVEIQVKNRDGSPMWVRLSADPVKDTNGRVVEIRGALTDISERKRAETEALRARTELLRVERTSRLGEMVASLAHELNQPLAAILSSAQAALRFLQSGRHDSELFRTILNNIVQDDKRAAGIITGLRSMVRREERDREPLDVNEVARDVLALFRGEAIARHVEIQTDLDRSIPMISGDRVQLQQVLLNLVVNASEALSDGPHSVQRIHLRTRATDLGVQMSVRDCGPGIDPGKLKDIWEPFFTTKRAGMGMGLSVSSSIIRAHGGRIWAKNNADGGATFAFELPAAGKREPVTGKA